MISTFQAVLVVILAVLPGASYSFAYERRIGNPPAAVDSDRLIRFLASSAAFQAVYIGPEYVLYRHFVVSGRLQHGHVHWWLISAAALAYVLIPVAVGTVLGHEQQSGNKLVTAILGRIQTPTAWDYLWQDAGAGIVRIKLTSGIWIAGTFATFNGSRAYAAWGSESSPDLYLSRALQVGPRTGEFERHADGRPKLVPGDSGLLVRWDQIEYLEFMPIGAL